MKSIFNIILLIASSRAQEGTPAEIEATTAAPSVHFFDFDNAKMLYQDNFEQYRADREAQALGLPDNNCRLAESDNYYGAQQCKFSWECRGARLCERGGWCNGYDACEETALPLQANGLTPDH